MERREDRETRETEAEREGGREGGGDEVNMTEAVNSPQTSSDTYGETVTH